jgi:hypothetical protein
MSVTALAQSGLSLAIQIQMAKDSEDKLRDVYVALVHSVHVQVIWYSYPWNRLKMTI